MIDENRSPLQTPEDICRARERLFAALLRWWETPTASDTDDAIERDAVAQVLRQLLRDAENVKPRRSIPHKAPRRAKVPA